MHMPRPSLAFALILLSASLGADKPRWTDAQRRHWSFLPPSRSIVPKVALAAAVRNPVDAFLLRDLEANGLAFAPEADRPTLLRRLRYDLTGLPPTPDELASFLRDDRPDAYERLVDRLLAEPAFGERQARPWLDLARYAESDGFKSDGTRPDAWRYRDWVVKSLNEDMPYDKFVRLQLAGDEAEPGAAEAFIATGFNRGWPFEDNNKIPGQNRQIMLDDVADTTASVFLGLTVGCARCHDHKYDPISQADYYRFQALFAGLTPKDDRPLASPFQAAVGQFVAAAHREKLDAARREVQALERPYLPAVLKGKLDALPAEVRQALATEPEKRSAFQEDLLRANAAKLAADPKAMGRAMSPEDRALWERRTQSMAAVAKGAPPGLPVAAGMTEAGPVAPPTFIMAKGNFSRPGDRVEAGFPSVLDPSGMAADRPSTSSTGRRLALAAWLTRPDHPLTARVHVNRLWQSHFGRGIVATPSDFGTQGAAPSHPELLDWLAAEFAAGWSQKAIHRLLVTSTAYRQQSTPPEATLAADPDNELWSRMPRRRLEAEAVRDGLLAASGRLDRRLGGPGVFPDLPPGVQTRGGWNRSEKAADRDRRSVYIFVRRNLKYPLLDAFDAPDTNLTCAERNTSVNAPQALMLLNSELVLDLARSFASTLRREVADGESSALIDLAYRRAFGRPPESAEREVGLSFLGVGGDEALIDYCHALINLNEFVFID